MSLRLTTGPVIWWSVIKTNHNYTWYIDAVWLCINTLIQSYNAIYRYIFCISIKVCNCKKIIKLGHAKCFWFYQLPKIDRAGFFLTCQTTFAITVHGIIRANTQLTHILCKRKECLLDIRSHKYYEVLTIIVWWLHNLILTRKETRNI